MNINSINSEIISIEDNGTYSVNSPVHIYYNFLTIEDATIFAETYGMVDNRINEPVKEFQNL